MLSNSTCSFLSKLHYRPAKLASFAVVNFTGNSRSCYDFIKKVLQVSQSHGIEIPSMTMDAAKDDRYLDLVSVHYNGHNAIDDVSRLNYFWNFYFR